MRDLSITLHTTTLFGSSDKKRTVLGDVPLADVVVEYLCFQGEIVTHYWRSLRCHARGVEASCYQQPLAAVQTRRGTCIHLRTSRNNREGGVAAAARNCTAAAACCCSGCCGGRMKRSCRNVRGGTGRVCFCDNSKRLMPRAACWRVRGETKLMSGLEGE